MILMMKVAEHFQKLHGKVLKCCGGGWVVLRTIIRDSAVQHVGHVPIYIYRPNDVVTRSQYHEFCEINFLINRLVCSKNKIYLLGQLCHLSFRIRSQDTISDQFHQPQSIFSKVSNREEKKDMPYPNLCSQGLSALATQPKFSNLKSPNIRMGF